MRTQQGEVMTLNEAKDLINLIVQENPGLCDHGLRTISPEQQSTPINPKEFMTVVEWLLGYDAFDRRKTINTSMGSYGWKHKVERDMGSYVSNGAFICAALYLNYKMKPIPNSPNAYFNLRKDSSYAIR
jgi:hypothetical protein